VADSPEMAAAKRLLDVAKRDGFAFQRTRAGPDRPLRGARETVECRDELHLAGFWEPDSCS
jgi:hypothetical protein